MSICEDLSRLSRFELKMSLMYDYFSNVFTHHKQASELFRSLSEDELAHKRIIDEYADHIKPTNGDVFSVDTSEMSAILRDAEDFLQKPFSLSDALRLAYEIESRSAEFHYITARQCEDPSVRALIEGLGDEDNAHFGKLRYFLGVTLSIEELRERFGEASEMILQFRHEVETGADREIPDSLLEKVNDMFDIFRDLSCYTLLGLDINATNEEIKRSYRETAKKWHPDMFGELQPELREKLHDIITYVNLAYDTLGDPETRRAYDRSLLSRRAQSSHISPEARQKTIEGLKALCDSDYKRAETLFTEAAANSPSHRILYYKAVSHRNLLKGPEAIEAVTRALSQRPDDIRYLLERARAETLIGKHKKAVETYLKVLRLKPGHQDALMGLKSISHQRYMEFVSSLQA